jgi:UTP--glucose-1-phosphate uridylyltransferase
MGYIIPMEETSLNFLSLSPTEEAFLKRYRFDPHPFQELRDELLHGRFPPERNRLDATLSAPSSADLVPWPDEAALAALGEEAIKSGQVGVVILNGGMATRFGGRVKGVVEVMDQRSFLDLKLSDLRRWDADIPVFLMNSFATERDTLSHLEAHRWFELPQTSIHSLVQNISLRLTPAGELYRDERGAPSFYAPGHGDVFEVLARSDAFTREVSGGLRYLLVSNVDNLAADLSPRVIGAHIHHNNPVTVEVAPRNPGDKGGAPVYVDGHLEIVEGFRFPPDFDHDLLPVFNTNTLVLNADAVRSSYPLDWFRADKALGDQPVVQFERLMGQITGFVPTTFLQVPREGAEGRFMPIKTPHDLDTLGPLLRERFTRA